MHRYPRPGDIWNNLLRLYPGTKSGGNCTGSVGSIEFGLGNGWNTSLTLLTAVGDVYDHPGLDDAGCFDIVAAETYGAKALRVYPGLCNGQLGTPTTFGTGWDPASLNPLLGPGDFNGDGCGDLLARETGGLQALRLYTGNCNGTFGGPIGLGSGWSPASLPDLIPR